MLATNIDYYDTEPKDKGFHFMSLIAWELVIDWFSLQSYNFKGRRNWPPAILYSKQTNLFVECMHSHFPHFLWFSQICSKHSLSWYSTFQHFTSSAKLFVLSFVNLNFKLTATPASGAYQNKGPQKVVQPFSRFKRPKLKMDAIWSMNVTPLTLLDTSWRKMECR